MPSALAIRADDVPLFGGVVLSLLIFTVLGALFRRLFYPETPGRGLSGALRGRLRVGAALLLILLPLLNSCFWVPALQPYGPELLWALGLVLGVLAVEALLLLLFEGFLPHRGVRVGDSVVLASRWLIYPVLVVLAAGHWLAGEPRESRFLYAGLWVALVLAMLHTLYGYLFKSANWQHPLAQTLCRRLRPWAWFSVLLLTFAYATTWFPGFAYEGRLNQLLAGLGLVLLLETLLAVVFEFYFPILRRTTVPNLFQDLTRGLMYLGLVLLALGVVFKQNLSSLVLGSTVVSVILGFALQETLGNFFAGLALGVSKPYSLGDHIQVGELSGRVEKIDWRSTALWTSTGDYTVLPNSVLAKENILNYSAPSILHARLIDVGVHYRHPPHEVRRVMLQAASSVPGVLSDPPIEVWLMEFADSSVNYRMRYWMQEYGRRFELDSRVREAIWYHFSRTGLEIPFPIRTLLQPPPARDEHVESGIRALLEGVDFLRTLTPAEQQILVQHTRLLLYAPGEKVFCQGQAGESFYLIKSGRLKVTVCNSRNECYLTREMGPGEFFGEMALLTGEPRSATVEASTDVELLTLDKQALRELLQANPAVDREISEVLALRQLTTIQARETSESIQARLSAEKQVHSRTGLFEQLSEQFLTRIREFFSY